MDINAKLDAMFDATCNAQQAQTQRDTAVMDLKNLESQLNNHLRKRQGKKYQKVTLFNFSEAKEGESSLDDMIENEIETKFKNKKWTALPLYLKWRHAEQYLKDKNMHDSKTIKKVRQCINDHNDLIFEYDHIAGTLTNIIID